MSQSQPQIPEVGDEFPTAENFKEVAQQGAKAAGFAFSVSSSKMSGGGKGGHTPFITLQCTMGGTYRNNHKINEETRKRKKLSKRQSCPVVLRAALNENTRTWVVTSSKSVHNHELLIPSQIHCLPQHRHLNTEQKELVHIMLKSGASTRSIADAIHWKQVAYAEEMNEVEKAFKEVSQATMKIPSIPLSLSIDMTISKVLYKLEEKYEHLNDSGSKATFLHKLEALVTEEIPVPKAPLHNVSTLPKRHKT
ncbi:2345_t:CDS:2, partial [Racocetra fulgida]